MSFAFLRLYFLFDIFNTFCFSVLECAEPNRRDGGCEETCCFVVLHVRVFGKEDGDDKLSFQAAYRLIFLIFCNSVLFITWMIAIRKVSRDLKN